MCMADSQIPILHNLWVFATKSRTNVARRDHHVQNTCMLFIAYIVSLQDTSVGLKGISYSKGGQFIICRDVKYILASNFYSQQQLRLGKAWKTFSYCYSTSCKLQMAFFAHFHRFCLPCKSYLCENCLFIRLSLFETQTLSVFFVFAQPGFIRQQKLLYGNREHFHKPFLLNLLKKVLANCSFFNYFSRMILRTQIE